MNELNQVLMTWSNELEEDPRFLGLLQFGSTTREGFRRDTDVDLMILVDKVPPSRAEKFSLLDPIEVDLQGRFRKAQLDFYPSIQLVDKSISEKLNPLFFDMVDSHKRWFDKHGIFLDTIEKTKKWLALTGAKKVQNEMRWYWVIDPNEPLDFSKIS